MAERTGCPILSSLWSYVTVMLLTIFMSLFTELEAKEQESRKTKDKTYNSRYNFASVMQPPPLMLLNREGGAYEAPEDSHEYENHGESSYYAWMIPCMFPSAL